jgi:thiol-disulfide isomerase/thioredoxin
MNIAGQTIPKWKMSVLEEYIKTSETPVIINFWATYCVPCIEEIPYFLELTKKYEDKGVKLILVSLDFEEAYPDKIRNFSVKRRFTAPIVWLDETDADYFCPKIDNSWSGVMPATLFVNNKTGFRSFYEEKISREKLEEEINKLINTQ